jgi:RNA polymerase sigma factor (sigma-70 family)
MSQGIPPRPTVRGALLKQESVRNWKTGKPKITFPVSSYRADYRKGPIPVDDLHPVLELLPGKDQREPQVVAQIQGLLREPPETWLNYLGDFGRLLYPETLVYIARAGERRGDADLAIAAVDLLLGRPLQNGTFAEGIPLVSWKKGSNPRLSGTLEQFVMRTAWRTGMINYLDEVNITRADLHLKILERIRAGAAKQPYWEVNFHRAVRFAMLQVREKHKTPAWSPGRAIIEGMVQADAVGDSKYSPDRLVENQELLSILEKALQRLTADERLVLDEYYLHPRDQGPPTQEELAAELGVTDRTIRTRKSGALTKLRNILSAAGYSVSFREEETFAPGPRTDSSAAGTESTEEGEA